MKSYTLQNWDGRLTTSDSRNIQSSMNMGGSIVWEGRSNLLGNHSENSTPMNDTPRNSNSMVVQTTLPNYATTNVNNDGCNDGGKARFVGSAEHESILENMSAPSFVKNTLLSESVDASNESQNDNRVFLPVENTLLHTFHAHVAPTSPELAKQLEATLLTPPSPTQQKDADVISLHTTDAEGSDEEIEDLAVVQRLLFSTTSTNAQSHSSSPIHSEHDSLFSPRLRSSEPLFTPEPPSRKPSPKVRRERALYVDVPPLQGCKSDYKWLIPPVKKPRPRALPAVVYHGSLGDALQAVADNSYDAPIKKKKSKNTKEGVERRQLQNANPAFSKHLPHIDSISSIGHTVVPKNKVKKRVHKDDAMLDDATKKQKHAHTRVDIDLTISDSEDVETQPKSNPNLYRPKALPKLSKPVPASIKGNDAPTLLTVGVVKPIDFEIWDLNIRFLRQSAKQQEFGSSNSLSTNRAPSSGRKVDSLEKELPWFRKIPPQSSLDEEEISLGGTIRTSWDPTANDVDSDDDEVIFVESYSFQSQKSVLAPPFPCVSSASASIPSQKKTQASRKIDLSAHYRRKEQLKNKPISPIVASSTKSQGAFKPVIPLLLPNDVSQHFIHSEPAVSPSQLVTGTITTVPPQVDENLQSDEAFGPTTPSAKALGKRKAVDSDPDESYPTFRTFGFPSSYQVPISLQSNSNNNDSGGTLEPFRKPVPDIFIHDYIRSPSPIPQHSTTAIQDEHAQMMPNFYIPNDELNHDLPPFVPTVEGVGDHGLYNWDLGVTLAEEYQFVDPSLLVGGPSIEPDAELSESMPDYAADFAPTDEDDDMVNLPTPPVAGPSRIYERSRRTSSSHSVLEFPSSTETTSERMSEPSNASSIQHSKPRKRSSTSAYVSSSDSDDEPLTKYMASKGRKRSNPLPSPIASNDDYMDVRDDEVPPKRKPRRASSSSFVVSEDLPEIVYVPSFGPRSKAKKAFVIPDDTSSNDKEYIPTTKSPLQRKSLSKRKARRTSTSSNDDDHDHDFSRDAHALTATPGIEVESGDPQLKEVPQSETQNIRILPKRQRTQRPQQDFVEIDEYFRAEGLEFGLPKKVRKYEATHKSAPKEVARRTSTVQHREDIDWPKEETASYCHQCRNKSSILKMVCPFCETKFCLRCLNYRYPDLTFFDGAEIVWTENCPRCGDFCNCTACCRRRGEPYVPRARGRFGKRSSSVSTSTPVPFLLPQPSVSSVANVQLFDPKSGVLSSNTQYFATMYDLNGRRMGATYASTDNLLTIGIPVLDTIRPRIKTVFVGLMQRSWGFPKHAVIKDLKPLPRPKQLKSLQRRSKAQPKMRHFIGSDKFVKYRKKPDPYDPFGELSSLSSLSSDSEVEEKQQGNELDVETFNPHSLTDVDVSRAISLGLQACGVTRIDGSGPIHTFTSL